MWKKILDASDITVSNFKEGKLGGKSHTPTHGEKEQEKSTHYHGCGVALITQNEGLKGHCVCVCVLINTVVLGGKCGAYVCLYGCMCLQCEIFILYESCLCVCVCV